MRAVAGSAMVACALTALLTASAAHAQTMRELQLIQRIARRAEMVERRQRDPVKAAIDTRDVHTLLGLFRRAEAPAERQRIAGGLILIGGDAPGRLVKLISTELSKKLRDYRHVFQAGVVDAIRNRQRSTGPKDVEALQQTVRSLAQDPGLTKDMIVKQSDPAMDRLEELLQIDRKSVLAGSQPLQQQRQQLADLVKFAQRAANHLSARDSRLRATVESLGMIDEALVAAEDLAALMVTPMTPEARDVMFENIDIAAQLDPAEAEGIHILNLMRIRVGMAPLAIDLKLVDAARGHCADMRRLNFFSHTSPVENKRTPWDRAKLAGTSASGENIFYGSPSAAAAIKAWWYSPGHHRNMMNPRFRRIGLGREQGHWTQMFGR